MPAPRRRVSATLAVLATVAGSTLAVDVTSAAAQPAPSAPRPAGRVVVLHTDTGAGVRSDALRARLAALGATVRHAIAGQSTLSVSVPSGTSAAAVDALPGVASVEAPVVRTLAGAVPDDPSYPSQARYLDAIGASSAWARQKGSRTVRIAVVDSGVDVAHPDLKGKVVGSWDALTGRSTVTDAVGHGTFVAGVAAAETDNHLGVAGAAWDTVLLAVKVADADGDIAVDDEVAGIRWAADHGADVINLSLSGPDPSPAEQAAVAYAQRKGAVVVAAAGNDGTSAKQYPAAYPGVLAVAATDVAKGRRASFSSYGSWVSLAAPGVAVRSTTPRAGSLFFPGRSGYGAGDGTSFSTPLVAAAAALVEAQNPTLSAAAVRAAVLASAHGFGGQGLGRGQVDLAGALDHTAPTSRPASVSTTGTSGPVALTAASTAPAVRFSVDGGAWTALAPVTGGTATATWPSAGFAQGAHTVTVTDCTRFGECGPAGPSTTTTVDNPAPTLDAPVGGTVVGGVVPLAATGAGGAVRFTVDGAAVGTDTTAPFTGEVNASRYADGPHVLQARTCTADGRRCDGTVSTPVTVTFASLHPATPALSRTAISPDGNGSGDSAVLTVSLPDREDVTVSTLDAGGAVRATAHLGQLAAGRHTWTFRGLDGAGHRLPDGTYTLRVTVARAADSTVLTGAVDRTVVVDTRAPRLGAIGGGRSVFPVRDGYRDTVVPSAALPDGGTLTLRVTTASGRAVRTTSTTRGPSSAVGLPWDGRTAAGAIVPAGRYRATLTASDAAGNRTVRGPVTLTVDLRRLRTRTVTLTRTAWTKATGATARCAYVAPSVWTRGLRLVDRCSAASQDVAYVDYGFRLPTAFSYSRLTVGVRASTPGRSDVTTTVRRTDGGIELPRGHAVRSPRLAWHTVGSVAAADHVTGSRRVAFTLLLSGRYGGRNELDLASVRLTVRLTVLAR